MLICDIIHDVTEGYHRLKEKIGIVMAPGSFPFLWVDLDRKEVDLELKKRGGGLKNASGLLEAAELRLNRTGDRGKVVSAWLIKLTPESNPDCMYLVVERDDGDIGAVMATSQLEQS